MAGALCVATMGLVATSATAAPAPTPAPAVPNLNWQPCDDSFSCATATVPLDYAHPAGATIHLAMIKHPATDPAHRIGSVFFNPGGPGGSGVDALREGYSLFPPALRARFDLVSFDPRGIGQSTPLQCFDTNEQEQQLIGATEASGYPTTRVEQRSYEHAFAAFDAACATHAGPLLAHDSTADVARDMDLMRQAVGDPTMNYLGNSYGSYLGATYANLFPTKVRAIALDANADPVAWATGTGGSADVLGTFLREGSDRGSAATLNAFLTLCGQAVPGSCSFSAGTPAATHTKFDTLLDRLASHPITVNGQTFTKPVTMDALITMLYNAEPIPNLTTGWHQPADVLQSLWEQTSGTAPGATPPVLKDLALPGHAATPNADAPYSGLESQYGVVCSDSPNPRSPGSYAVQADIAAARSGVVGPDWAWVTEPCAQWPVLAADRYTGPWNTPTANPILVVGNTVDPATPYQDSIAMAHDLANARLLTVNGYGHGTLINPSSCVDQIEGDYFVTGALPPPGTVCQQDKTPFAG
jgi:pimeloyl-ACP methyl ester carboxylesterase